MYNNNTVYKTFVYWNQCVRKIWISMFITKCHKHQSANAVVCIHSRRTLAKFSSQNQQSNEMCKESQEKEGSGDQQLLQQTPGKSAHISLCLYCAVRRLCCWGCLQTLRVWQLWHKLGLKHWEEMRHRHVLSGQVGSRFDPLTHTWKKNCPQEFEQKCKFFFSFLSRIIERP